MHQLNDRGYAGAVFVGLLPLATNLTLILIGLILANPLPEQAGLPFPLNLLSSMRLLGMAVWLALTATLMMMYVAWRGLTGSAARKALPALIAYQALVFAAIWLLLPALGKVALPWLLAAQLALTAYAFRVTGPGVFSAPATPGNTVTRFWLQDSLLLLAPPLAWWVLNEAPAWQEVRMDLLRSLLIYPVYAYVQLLLFLALPARLMGDMGVPRAVLMVGVASNFALLHAPNPWLMLATGVAMSIWCRQWLRGRPLWILALVMGMSAAMATTLLPRTLTGEMRIGPDYIEHRAPEAASEPMLWVKRPATHHGNNGQGMCKNMAAPEFLL